MLTYIFSVLDIPKLNIAALRFTRTAGARILAAGGQCLTIDELALVCNPMISHNVLYPANHGIAPNSVPQPVPTPSSSVDPRTPVRQSSTLALALTLARSHASPARAAS